MRPLRPSQVLRARIPRRYAEASVEDFAVDTEAGMVLRAYVGPFSRVLEHGKNLFMYGAFGCGKTHAAVAVAAEAVRQGNRALFLTAPELKNLWAVNDVLYESSLDGTVRVRDAVRDWELLVIDDLGREYEAKSGFGNLSIDEVIRTRYNDMLPTVITTNLTPQDVRERYGAGAWDLIRHSSRTLAMTGTSRRGA